MSAGKELDGWAAPRRPRAALAASLQQYTDRDDQSGGKQSDEVADGGRAGDTWVL